MNIHVAGTPPVHIALTHTYCQGQTSGLTVRPDAARCHVMACANQSVQNISSAQMFCLVTYCLLAVLC